MFELLVSRSLLSASRSFLSSMSGWRPTRPWHTSRTHLRVKMNNNSKKKTTQFKSIEKEIDVASIDTLTVNNNLNDLFYYELKEREGELE